MDQIPEPSSSADTRLDREHEQPIQPPIVEQHIPRDPHPSHHVDEPFFTPVLTPPTAFRAPSMSIPQQIPHIASHSHAHNHGGSHSHSHSHSRHSHNPSPLFSSMPKSLPVNISSPYAGNPTPVMHHVPHPHAHARHHHSNLNYMYDNSQIQRRPDEIIQFGTQGPTN
ncbi:hypothetical protein H1R20_g192, partial [Candolleomyces eurysporus]